MQSGLFRQLAQMIFVLRYSLIGGSGLKTRATFPQAALIFGFSLLALDQLSKALVFRTIPLGGYVPVLGHFFGLSHIRNKGAAWGFMAELSCGSVFFSVLALLAAVFLIWGIFKLSLTRSYFSR